MKHRQMEQLGAELMKLRIPFGDYILVNDDILQLIKDKGGVDEVHKRDLLPLIKLSVDTKKHLSEVAQNVTTQHKRFRRELLKPLSQTNAKLILLIEESDMKYLEEVYFWKNPQLAKNPKATKGRSLYRSLKTIQQEYNVDIYFCDRRETGKRIIEILGGEANGEQK